MIHWILKTALLLAGFYAFFMLFMRKTTLFRLNRAVLLAGTVACLLLPLVRINVDPSAPVADYLPLRIVLPETVVGGERVAEAAVDGWNWKAIPCLVYAAGFTAVFISAAVSLGRIRKVIRQYKGVRYCYDGKRYVMLHIAEHDLPSFSFMNHVVISRSDYDGHPEILMHECAHAGQYHSADMLFMSLVCALQWFNPLVWMMRSELRMMHEYEADEAVLKQGIDATQYQLLLVRKAVGDSRFLIANSFGHSKLKNRIAMIRKVKTTKWAALAYIACLPLLLAAMSFNATDSGNDVMSGTDTLTVLAGSVELVATGPESADTAKVYEYSALEMPPKFNGGNARNEFPKWFFSRLVYPEDAREAGMEGRVIVQFKINKDGSVSDINLLEGVCESIDNEVIKVVSESPDWTPGYVDGKPVNVTYAFPVLFQIRDGESDD
ncbi:MAG TPA: M56 family metallopeptidase [Candidatus Coprenecus pullistercoris]|nr:M56 family metallopeptidase [Candidatus Coprenecus pullistercoris]